MKPQLSKHILSTALCAAIAGICRADTALPRQEPVAAHVPAGQTQALPLPVKSTGESRLVKTGEGTLTMPLTAAMPGGLTVDVAGGAVQASGTDGAAAGSAGTDYISANAMLWLAADSARANFDTATDGDNTTVTKWYDVRDTNHASLSHPYAQTYPATGGVTFVPPYIRTVDGLQSVYFRGFGSQCAMKLYGADDAAKQMTVGSAFVVTRIDATWGNLLGRGTEGGKASYLGGTYKTGSISGKYFSRASSSGHALRNSRFYDNGERKDAELADIQKGVRILEFHHNSLAKGNFDSLFANGVDAARREGGDDLMELIVFDTPVDEADRLDILKYLSAKWNVGGGEIAFRTAAGTHFARTYAAGSTNTVTGSGTYDVSTSGITLTTAKGAVFGGQIDLAPGTAVKTSSPGLAYAVSAGETIDIAGASGQTYVDDVAVAANAPAGTVAKTGTGNVRFTALPDDVEKLSVQGGRVTLAAPLKASDHVSAAGANGIHATIPNAGFESDDMSAWTLTGDGNEGRFNRRTMTSWAAGSWKCPYLAPEGDWVLCLKQSGSSVAGAATTVSVPATGRYALSFYSSGRKEGGAGCWYIQFERNGVARRCDMAEAFYTPDGYRRHRLLTPELEAGDWTMRIVPNFTSGDRTSTFDDFRMELVTENVNPDGAWQLPNGGFENLASGGWSGFATISSQLVCSLSHYSKTRSNSLVSWTLTPGREDTTKAPDVGLVHDAMSVSNNSSLFGNEALCKYGDKYLAFFGAARQNGVAASSAFTPPRGAWRLRFKSAFGGYAGSWFPLDGEGVGGKSPSWTATVSINGGAAVSLGTKDESGYNCWKEVTLPNAFTVADGDSVVVTIRQTKSDGAGYIDDVELVPANIAAGNLVADGGFENATWDAGSAWQRDIPGLESRSIPYQPDSVGHDPDSWIARHAYSDRKWGFGSDEDEGAYCLMLGRNNKDAAWQDVDVPAAGLYRLTFNARSRVMSGSNVGHLPIRVWMAQGGATNEICRTGVDYDEFRPYTYFWRAPAAGTYRLGFSPNNPVTGERVSMVDSVSLTSVADELLAETPSVNKHLGINLAAGTELALDFPGTLKIDRLKVAGRQYRGLVGASDLPGVLSGQGKLLVEDKSGLRIFFR